MFRYDLGKLVEGNIYDQAEFAVKKSIGVL